MLSYLRSESIFVISHIVEIDDSAVRRRVTEGSLGHYYIVAVRAAGFL